MRRTRPFCIWPILFAGLLATPAIAKDQDLPMPHVRPGDVLRIPGLPPIQLPPGARAFGGQSGPGVLDEEAPPPRPYRPRANERPSRENDASPRRPARETRGRPARIAPHSVPTVEAQRVRVLDELFKRLQEATEPADATAVAGAIERVWLRSGSDTADLLMGRAVAAMAGKDAKTAEKLLDSVIRIEPGWAEGWNKRATLRFFAGDYDGAMGDIDHVLKLEPRHFGALAGLGAILQKTGLDKRALEAYRRALAVYPAQPDVKKIVEKLQIEVEGRDI